MQEKGLILTSEVSQSELLLKAAAFLSGYSLMSTGKGTRYVVFELYPAATLLFGEGSLAAGFALLYSFSPLEVCGFGKE